MKIVAVSAAMRWMRPALDGASACAVHDGASACAEKTSVGVVHGTFHLKTVPRCVGLLEAFASTRFLSVFLFTRFFLQKIMIRLWKRSEARNWNLFAIARRIVSGEFAFCILVSEVSLIFYILTLDFTKYFQSLTNITQIALHTERTESRAT